MTDRYLSLARDILERREFKQDYKILFGSYIHELIGDTYKKPSKKVAMRLSKAAQIMIASADQEYIEIGSKILDMFIEINPPYLEDILIIIEAVFINLGDLPNLKLLNEKWRNRKTIAFGLDRILEEELHKHINTIEPLGIDATNFQIDLWNTLNDGEDVVTIAPTSTGKSHIIIEYLVERLNFASNDKTYVVYIVPSRALIYEVSKKIQKLLSEKNIRDVEVSTVAQREREYNRKTVFVLTQERMLMLLNSQKLMRFSYIVIDEAQNISEGSRGVLLHIVLSQAISRGPVQLIFSTPSSDFKNTFNSLLGKQSVPPCSTKLSPVTKNHMYVKCQDRDLVITSKNPEAEIKIPKGFNSKHYDDIVCRLGSKGINLIYVNTPGACQKIVKRLMLHINEDKKELHDASDYIRKTVHEKYSLADAIKKGIVFHYGPLPRNIRIMIESYVEEKMIDYIVCTSTLAEGVNLPAQNLFIRDPKIILTGKPSRPMSIVQYHNIIGRAGRLMKHFSGNIFYIDYDKWKFRESLEKKTEEHQLPTYYKILKEHTDELIRSLDGKYNGDDPDFRSTLNATANKILQDEEEGRIEEILDNYVDIKKHQRIMSAIRNLRRETQVSPVILNLNPTIGMIQQNRLYKYLDAMMEAEFASFKPILPYDRSFSIYLKHLVYLLSDYDFFQSAEMNNENYRDIYCNKICGIASKWIKGVPLKEIIEKFINRSASIDSQVKDIIKLIDNVVRFRLATAIKCFLDIYTLISDQRGLDTEEIPELYSYLELGACSKSMISLISMGLSRQTAIEISKLLRIDTDREDIMHQIKANPKYLQLHKITRKEIESLNM